MSVVSEMLQAYHNGYGYSSTDGIFRIFLGNSSFGCGERKIFEKKNLYQNQLVGVEATENDRMSGGISSIFYCLEHQIIVR